jgi:hypothetical protein
MKPGAFVFCAVVMIAGVTPVFAHHSFAAEYDSARPVRITGAVTKVDWANPHVYFFIDVKDQATGKVTNWAFEMGAPAVLTRSGWKRSSVKIGDVITIDGTLAKDGGNHGNARGVTMTNTGEKLGAGSSEGAAETQTR